MRRNNSVGSCKHSTGRRRSCYCHARCKRSLSSEECKVCLDVPGIKVMQTFVFVGRANIVLHDYCMRFSMRYFS